MPIIGMHHSPLMQKFGIPRQPNLVQVPSHIKMLKPYDDPDALEGLMAFSHLWIIWQTHGNREWVKFKPKVRPPRMGGNAKLGVFATRSTYRPSSLGLSVVKLEDIEVNGGVTLHLSGADMVDGTPIVDIKPYLPYSDAVSGAVSNFAPEAPMPKAVTVDPIAQADFVCLTNQGHLQPSDFDIIEALIAQDPRPAYRQHEVDVNSVMRYRKVDIEFRMLDNQTLNIKAVRLVGSS